MKKKPLSLFLHSALMIAASAASAAPVVWGTVTTIAGDTDVLNAGTLNYAYALSGASPTVNGVAFTGSTSFATLGTNITLTGWTANHTAYTSASNPYNSLSAAYKDQIRGGDARLRKHQKSATLALGAANQIPDGPGKGNVIINTNGTGVGRLNLGGFSSPINILGAAAQNLVLRDVWPSPAPS